MPNDDERAKREEYERLKRLGLCGAPDRRPVCIHCGLPFDPTTGRITNEVSICDTCLD